MTQTRSVPVRGLPGAKPAALAVAAAFAACRRFVARWRVNSEYRRLLDLDDRLLADLGMDRSEVRAAMSEAHWFYDRYR